MEEYKILRRDRPCKFFTGSIGSCPFGPDCWYAHLSPNGEELKLVDFQKPKGRNTGRRAKADESRQMGHGDDASSLHSLYQQQLGHGDENEASSLHSLYQQHQWQDMQPGLESPE